MTYQSQLLRAIPGGAHTYSRGFDQYPSNAPQILKRGSGAYVYDENEQEFLDYGMALRAVCIGYADPRVNAAAMQQMQYGNNLTRPSLIELEAAQTLIEAIDSVDMVKFTKNGSTATSAAVKLSRAYTGRTLIARCLEHPFFSYDDWFIGSTEVKRGIPKSIQDDTLTFHYNDIDSLQALFEKHPKSIACVILEPSNVEHPKNNFLHNVRSLCDKYGAVMILDEMITGFRWHIKGAQYYYGVCPDLCTFGKAMANGFSVAAVAGKREIMQLGSIEFEGSERVFLLSTTHGAEMAPNVVEYLWDYGRQIVHGFNSIAKDLGLSEHCIATGVECQPYILTFDENRESSLAYRTLFLQEMLRHKILFPCIAMSYAHKKTELERTLEAFAKSLEVYKKALKEGIGAYLHSPVVKPVFRKYN
ncbi:glutamate-1-semialdehyde 2,1-aminomutase [Helicobacter jaachi]|uniref:Glutamate-1-semialdehyde 2,1-aminomutase n=1 Tax=Helicobacter jaachi TaxID=1677920 RepID=A0A4U8TBB0_9HELI|nr:glutamate-1-semialdehyde 2,1-aminomutase [Helicobacter jaachi]TLD96478.1 glutamate-1-semialdehyde 2,1-aminomutase [Helicobacter jaachi]